MKNCMGKNCFEKIIWIKPAEKKWLYMQKSTEIKNWEKGSPKSGPS